MFKIIKFTKRVNKYSISFNAATIANIETYDDAFNTLNTLYNTMIASDQYYNPNSNFWKILCNNFKINTNSKDEYNDQDATEYDESNHKNYIYDNIRIDHGSIKVRCYDKDNDDEFISIHLSIYDDTKPN